jgi:hypothetical protein
MPLDYAMIFIIVITVGIGGYLMFKEILDDSKD